MSTELTRKAAQTLLAAKPVTLDTETTGLGNDAEIVEIAIVDFDGTPLINSLVKPVNPIPADATAIHGITNEMVANAPDLLTLFKDINEVLNNRQVMIYNADYDLRLLDQSFAAHLNSIHPGYHYLCKPQIESFMKQVKANSHCMMALYAEHYGEWDERRKQFKWQRLTNAAAHYGVARPDAHRALADCLMTLDVVKGMAA